MSMAINHMFTAKMSESISCIATFCNASVFITSSGLLSQIETCEQTADCTKVSTRKFQALGRV